MSIQQEEGQLPLAVQRKAAIVLPRCLWLCLTAILIYMHIVPAPAAL